ncbi:MAG: Hpt domain-containing protein [Myxococcota bacterium]
MALDMAKYRDLFLEEASEHLGEISRALLELEKNSSSGEAIDLIFRMAHSLKSMAASLGYDSITQVAHHLEDRMSEIRAAGVVGSGDDLARLFRGLEGLEQMVEVVRESGEAPPARDELVESLSQPLYRDSEGAGTSGTPRIEVVADPRLKKKPLSPIRPIPPSKRRHRLLRYEFAPTR